MIPQIAALLMVMGIGCRFADSKGICANGVWLSSTITAELASLIANDYSVVLEKAIISSAAITMLLIMFGFIGLIKEIKKWPEDEERMTPTYQK